MFKSLISLVQRTAEQAGVSEKYAVFLSNSASIILLIIISFIVYHITRKLVVSLVVPVIQKSKTTFDDLLIKHSFFKRLSYFAPALILYFLIDDALGKDAAPEFILKFLDIWMVVISILIINSILSTIKDYYKRYEISKERPIDSTIQILKIITYIVGVLVSISILFNKNISTLVISLGTMSAVLMLIFRDPILGFVGGLQLTFNDMVHIGDWISMPNYNADGVVIEITLTVVKVQNWDKTISMIPTYALVSNSFQNWRGMEESGGRRIKRAVNIDMDSIKFCTSEMIERFKKIRLLKSYIEQKEKEIEEYNKKNNIDPTVKVNGRRQTNIGVFRAYLKAYLKQRNDIHQEMTFLVRQLKPTEKGLPIEIYVFTKTTAWAEYEDIQADIFDHVFAVIPEFELKVYEFPSNSGVLESLGRNNEMLN